MLISNNQFVFQLSIVYGMIGFWESALPHVEQEQELIRELSLLKKPMEELATDNLLKSKGAKRANVLVSSVVCNAICKTLCILLNCHYTWILKLISF